MYLILQILPPAAPRHDSKILDAAPGRASMQLSSKSRHRVHACPCASALIDALVLILHLLRSEPLPEMCSSNCIDTVQHELLPHALIAAEATKSLMSKVFRSMRPKSCKAKGHCNPRSQAVRAMQKAT